MSDVLYTDTAGTAFKRMHRLEMWLKSVAVAAAVLMHAAAAAVLVRGIHQSVAQAIRLHANGGRLHAAQWVINCLRDLMAAVEAWLCFGLVWFFLRYFAYVLETRIDRLRAGQPDGVAGDKESAGS